MRSVLVALLVTSAALLAGCSDDGGHDDVYTCPNGRELNLDDYPEHHNATFNPLSKCGSSSSSTSQAPNVLPTILLTVTDDGGNETIVGTLNGNLTFSAAGSSDSDGSITGIAVSVTDSNTTRTATLYDAVAKTFKPATFKFDRPGVVNVTVAMVDDRAGFTVNQSKVYVNHPQIVGLGTTIQLPGGSQLPAGNDECKGADGTVPDVGVGPSVFDSNYFKPVSFTVFKGATKIEAVAADSDLIMTICSPLVDGAGGEPLSPQQAATVETNPGVALPPPPGTNSYYVGTYSGSTQGLSAEMLVTVHYEPQAAAPAA